MTETRDGTFKTRDGSNNEKLIQIRKSSAPEYTRFVDDESGIIRLVPVP
jgi:hypothetical protein